MKHKKKLGQALVEYALLTMMAMMLGLVLVRFSTVEYRNSVYNNWADIVAKPLPAP